MLRIRFSLCVLVIVIAASLSFVVTMGKVSKALSSDTSGKIAFIANGEIYLVDPDGTEKAKKLTAKLKSDTGIGTLSSLEWSPNGTRLVFVHVSNHGGQNRSHVYAINADGTGLSRLTSDNVFGMYPKWLPNSKQIVFASYGNQGDGHSRDHKVYVSDADGKNLKLLAALPQYTNLKRGGWSSDGRYIAFTVNRNGDPGTSDLYFLNIDDGGLKQLTSVPLISSNPVWSPDGKQIAFVFREIPSATNLHKGITDIFLINVDGTGLRQLTNTPDRETVFAWSPDGKQIVFVSANSRTDTKDTGLYVINTNGTGLKLLADYAETSITPDWSPDGTKIVFRSDKDGLFYVINADGVGLRQLPAEGLNPVWHP